MSHLPTLITEAAMASSVASAASRGALVTGGVHGLGAEFARSLHRMGYRVAILDMLEQVLFNS